jgi:hypothetical protein
MATMERGHAFSRRRTQVRPGLLPLVRQLAELADRDRHDVVAAAEETVSDTHRSVLAWDTWEAARGVVTLGGNAVDDCDRLYDGA